MFKHFSRFKKIIVTGPQRAGTRIVAKMIAHDTGYKYIDERAIGYDAVELFNGLMKKNKFVVQCPSMSYLIDNYGDEDKLIVFVKRKVADIVASEHRVGWRGGKKELARIVKDFQNPKLVVSKEKYKFWNKQKKNIKHWIEVKYEDLKEHPLWVDKKDRKQFKVDQVEEEYKEKWPERLFYNQIKW